jgi:hypothetical protein
MSAVEVHEVAAIIATLARAGVTVRVKAGHLVVRGAGALSFAEALATLTGREKAVEKALGLKRIATLPCTARSARRRAREMEENRTS